MTEVTFNTDKLRELLQDFYTLTKIRLVIFDNDMNKILSVPERECDFCTALRQNPEARKKCEICDKEACVQCRKTNTMQIYSCHAGLIEAVSPLVMNDINLGYIMLGQIINKEDKLTKRDEIIAYAKKYITDNVEKYYDKLVSKRDEQISAAAKIMEACAKGLWVSELIMIDEGISVALKGYIMNNLDENLSVDAICSHFKISRNKLYKISHDYYGMSIASFIRKKRVDNAEQLLRNGATVAEAAIQSGFYDYNYFSKIFKKEKGILPVKIKTRTSGLNR